MIQARSRMPQERWAVTPEPYIGPQVRPSSNRSGKAKLLLTGLICLFLCLVVTAQYSRIVSLSFELSAQEERINGLREEYRELEAMAARLASLSRIEEVARGELGMREPEQGQLKVLTANLE